MTKLFQCFIQTQIDLAKCLLEPARVLLTILIEIGSASIGSAVSLVSIEYVHAYFEAEVGVTLCHPSEVLTVFVGEGVEDQRHELIHALAVGNFGVVFKIDEEDARQTIEVVRGLFPLRLREMHLLRRELVLVEESVCTELHIKLLLEKPTVRPCPHRVLLQPVP